MSASIAKSESRIKYLIRRIEYSSIPYYKIIEMIDDKRLQWILLSLENKEERYKKELQSVLWDVDSALNLMQLPSRRKTKIYSIHSYAFMNGDYSKFIAEFCQKKMNLIKVYEEAYLNLTEHLKAKKVLEQHMSEMRFDLMLLTSLRKQPVSSVAV